MGDIGIRASKVKAATVSVNGAEIYHEVRGSGPPVLFIQGATGDGGTFERLADEFTVVTYDRRGNSRSPRPEGWTSTSMDEQADDATGLIEALGLAPALRERMLGNAEVFFSIELEAFVSYVPDAGVLAGVKVPARAAAGVENRGAYYHEASRWVAEQLGTELHEIPGAHTPYLDRPGEMAEEIRPFLRQASQGRRKQ